MTADPEAVFLRYGNLRFRVSAGRFPVFPSRKGRAFLPDRSASAIVVPQGVPGSQAPGFGGIAATVSSVLDGLLAGYVGEEVAKWEGEQLSKINTSKR